MSEPDDSGDGYAAHGRRQISTFCINNMKSKRPRLLPPVLTFMVVICVCASGSVEKIYHEPGSEAAKAIEELDQAEKDFYVRQEAKDYIAVGKEFITSAQKKDLKRMIELTSPLTLQASGKKRVRSVYQTQIMPAFEETSVVWREDFEVISDDTGNRGVLLFGEVGGKKSFPIYVTVMKEKGKCYVITASRKR